MIEKLPYLKLSNGELLKTGEVKNTIMGELTIQKFNHGYDLASRTSLINHLFRVLPVFSLSTSVYV